MAAVTSPGVKSPPVILVVDDDPTFRALLREALTVHGYRVLEAPDGLQGLRLFAEWRPAMVLLDILMPAMDGIEAVRDMRKVDPAAVVFTVTGGEWGENDSRAALLLGAKRAFLKPLKLSDLISAIREELSRPPGPAPS